MDKSLKWFLICTIGVLIIYSVVSSLAVSSMFDVSNGKVYSKEDLINNYKIKKSNIDSLKDYYNKLVPPDRILEIEFESEKVITRLALTNLKTDTLNNRDNYVCVFDLDVNSKKVDSIIESIGWTHQTLAEIKSNLDKANCIGISNGEPTNINFQRSGFGMYSYLIFSKEISDSLRKQYNTYSCTHIFYGSKLVLEYQGGVYGPQCFSNK
jgi:hypothetical protein